MPSPAELKLCDVHSTIKAGRKEQEIGHQNPGTEPDNPRLPGRLVASGWEGGNREHQHRSHDKNAHDDTGMPGMIAAELPDATAPQMVERTAACPLILAIDAVVLTLLPSLPGRLPSSDRITDDEVEDDEEDEQRTRAEVHRGSFF
jgi:hypothetical protein